MPVYKWKLFTANMCTKLWLLGNYRYIPDGVLQLLTSDNADVSGN